MHTDETIVAQRWVIVVLTLLILLVGFLWLNARADAQREETTRVDVNNLRTEVNEVCDTAGTTTATRREACENVLRDVAGVLVQYADEFRSAIGTTTSNIIRGGSSTTTGTTGTSAATSSGGTSTGGGATY